MASKDFAHVKAPRRVEKKGSTPLLPFAIIGIALLCFAAGYWVATEQNTKGSASQGDVNAKQVLLDAKVAEINILQAKIDMLEERVAMWKSKAKQDAHSKVGDLQFYTDLPKQSVTPSPVVEPAKAPEQAVVASVVRAPVTPVRETQRQIKPVAADAGYTESGFRIQIASFRTMDDAVALQKKLRQAGFKVYVQTVDLGDKGQWFRAYGGPYASKTEAERQLPAIEAQVHLKGLLIRGG
ncbi:MAG: SPOR domain-containing protein [Zetaproteobacteria bacterium CG12_big_fil_rev_8_21_14_0_65_54_13]|nr:MAG: SPOR domain-containing protein [Zetaproteobacteria bacterium CG23_combo_of_CG06-09_8_20_14_all_54_7]PIW49197.1 MAG: SPOR domain-containing protein [Zetaproteobacteria bacterium CG12_big_fil_rev_8_21_14_0_65_54_13]PIX55464.1 MAG: SPOR domain-containing protein [Zetaproteobacteria bacterium CG_4_10_14_3_um_filter_54_28]PJA29218.1 MAG: SPOR domain-containing protein [Zetaproteobacteria bacterium CG_4_9_14_3_um_filter_54_145]